LGLGASRVRIQGAIAIYLQIALIFTYLYLLLVACIPNAFSEAWPHEPGRHACSTSAS
jgi:hypothetical protein